MWRWETAATNLPAYSGYARLDGPFLLELTLQPPVLTPGDTTTLSVRLLNRQSENATPLVMLQLPPTLRLQFNTLLPGVTQNVQTGLFTWQPVAPLGSGVQELLLPLRAETADLLFPEQQIVAQLWPNAALATAAQGGAQRLALTAWVGLPPHINLVTPLTQVSLGQPISLQPVLGGSGPFVQSWSLGDGRRLTVNDPTVLYAAAGVYQVTLEVANPLQQVARTHLITVVPHPAARFSAADWQVAVGQPVTFVNESGGQPPLAYQWQFGDGQVATVANPTHSYSAPGHYLVQLTISNDYGRSEAYGVVQVGNPPVADLVVPQSVPAGQPFVAQAFGDETVQQYVWDMGDGRYYQGSNVTHAYRQGGNHYILLTASNEFGETAVGRWIYVEPGALTNSAVYLPLIVQSNAGDAWLLEGDLYALDLEPVELGEPFVLQPLPLPETLSPAEQLLFYINEARARFELPPLTQSYALNLAAQQHANDMARFSYTGHIGADGSYPAERLMTYGYIGAYAGEATAWGFEHPYEAVAFWVNSPSHRRIILNRFATDVGVGYTLNFGAPNVWYWTAEFGNLYGPRALPLLRLSQPTAESEAFFTAEVAYRWNWPLPLQEGEAFVVYLWQGRQALPLGAVNTPTLGTLYELPVAAYAQLGWLEPGAYSWQVRLERGQQVVAESSAQPILFAWDSAVPTPTPFFTPTPTPTQTPTPLPTPTPTPIWPTVPPPPTIAPPPIFPTATPGS